MELPTRFVTEPFKLIPPTSIYVLEIKLDGSTDEALRQIEEKGYAAPFALDKRKLYKIGVNFSSATRGIEDWKIVEC